MAAEPSYIVGLDIGTDKVAAMVSVMRGAGGRESRLPQRPALDIVGVGLHESLGFKKGVVLDIEATVESIRSAVQEAENMAGIEAGGVYVGIGGSHVSAVNSHGTVRIRNEEVSDQDVERVIESANAVAIPADQRVLHSLHQEYLVDGQGGIREPLGMSGVRLEAKVHLVTCAANAWQNVEKCVARCGLEVHDIFLQQLASSYATLSDDERELGVCLLDIGAGTTDVAVFGDGAIRHTASIPIAGDQITSDIAMTLRTPLPAAEDIKIRYACALAHLAKEGESLQVPDTGGRPPRELSRQTLAEVVEPRYEELFTLVQAELRRSGYENAITSGLVLTGGGAKMEGVVELAEEIFHMPVSLASPRGVGGRADLIDNPIYSTSVGLLLYGREAELNLGHSSHGRLRSSLLARFGARVRRWASEHM